MDDASALVARARAGDRGAFTEIFRRHRADVARLVHRMMGRQPELVEDLVQEVFLQVHRSLGEFRGDAKFSTWLHRVTVNVVLMARRAAGSRPQLTDELPEGAPSTSPLPDEDAARLRRMRAFQRCVDALAEKKRTVFVLHDLEGMTSAEISEIVGAPALTVRTRLFYARQELAAAMKLEPSLAGLGAVTKERP
ncbi:MAG: sigma-70 family RNA polymerase sigma factor [Polyangiaceae bacterium]|nr:sigma-70 family RNA polymerase sigma factor [Polyangiaceae bacterium]